MDFRVGTDIVHIPRIESAIKKFGTRFVHRVYTSTEQQDCTHKEQLLIPQLAGRWAAKEAAVKAIGSGFRGIKYTDIEIQRQASGAPKIQLLGQAKILVANWGNCQWQVSISHEQEYAIATAILICIDF